MIFGGKWPGIFDAIWPVRRALGISQRPDYREIRTYIRPAGPSSVLTGENNIGSVTLDGHKLTHVLLSRGQGTVAHRTELDLPPGT